jgi:ankyrin repeat protein
MNFLCPLALFVLACLAYITTAAVLNDVDKGLIIAVREGHLTHVKELLRNDADANARDSGSTSLHYATRNDHDVVKALLKCGACANAVNDAGEVPLHLAALNNDLEAVKVLLESRAYVNVADNTGSTPMHHAAFHGHSAIFLELYSCGASLSARITDGKMSLDIRIQDSKLAPLSLSDATGKKKSKFWIFV